jgi:hypothetical protein
LPVDAFSPTASLDAPSPDADVTLLDAPIGDAGMPDAHVPTDGGIAGPCVLTAEFGEPTLVPGVSTTMFAEATMRLSDDERIGYLWSTRLGGIDLARVTRTVDTGAFTYDPTFDELNTPSVEFEPTLSRDGLLLVFRSARGSTGEDLYFADRSVDTAPFTFRGPIESVNSAAADRQPFLSDDELLFISDRSGASRIYRAPRTGSTFGVPSEITELAGTGADQDPVLAPDGLTLYFASDRGLTDLDIFEATRPTTAAAFGSPRRLPTVNSTVTDGPSWVSRDQCRLYMSSARAGTPDVYVASIPTSF